VNFLLQCPMQFALVSQLPKFALTAMYPDCACARVYLCACRLPCM
jgi:hypothetical protein